MLVSFLFRSHPIIQPYVLAQRCSQRHERNLPVARRAAARLWLPAVSRETVGDPRRPLRRADQAAPPVRGAAAQGARAAPPATAGGARPAAAPRVPSRRRPRSAP